MHQQQVRFNEKYYADPAIVSHRIGDEFILVPIRRNVGDLESIYTLNETAALAWEFFDGQHTLGEIHAAIIAEFEVPPDQAYQDLLELVDQLESLQAIKRGTDGLPAGT